MHQFEDLAQIRIEVRKSSPNDTDIIVNGRKISALVKRYNIVHEAGGEPPTIEMDLHGLDGVVWAAERAELAVETRCQTCGFTHRQAAVPVHVTDAEEIEKFLRLVPRTLETSPTFRYLEALARDIRASVHAFFSALDSLDYRNGHTELLVAAVEDEVHKGRPDSNLATGAAGVDRSRAAHAAERRGPAEEGAAEAGNEANVRGSGPTGEGDREGEGRDSFIRPIAPDPDDARIKKLAEDWPVREFDAEDPED